MMMTVGGKGRPRIQSAKASGRPENPRKRTKTSTPQMIEKIMTVSFAVSNSASFSSLVRMPWKKARISTTKAPRAPASVGVAQPP